MKAAVIHTIGEPPRYGDFTDPEPADGEAILRVRAAAITNVARVRVAGTHYSGHGTLPAVAGIDGVGITDDGRRVFFGGPREPYGSMAELCPAPARWLAPVPDALDDVTAAAVPNPGVSAWLSLSFRGELREGEHVLVLGGTGVTGRLAVQSAKLQGAGRVVAAGRNAASLERLRELGADETIRIEAGVDLVAAFTAAAGEHGFDLVIDYLWGAPTEALIRSITRADLESAAARTRLVQVGEMAGAAISLPAAALRSSGLEIVGSGTGVMPPIDVMQEAFRRVLGAAATRELIVDTEAVPLADVESVWTKDGQGARFVLVP
jgi:NADPH:quinone reductase-like Zn-dependent oxidoreductase